MKISQRETLKRLFTQRIDERSLLYKAARYVHKRQNAYIEDVFGDKGRLNKRVGLSYMLLPFTSDWDERRYLNHSNMWQNWQIGSMFREMGYIVDAIDCRSEIFEPHQRYDVYFDNGGNLDRIGRYLPSNCIKIHYATVLHWLDNDRLEFARNHELRERRGVAIPPKRLHATYRSDLIADAVIMIGNEVMTKSYHHLTCPVFQVPISVPDECFDDRERDWRQVHRCFLWVGGGGCVHKGLDLVLEAFAGMPEFDLHVFGSADKEPEFEAAYRKELYETPNIHFHGFIDVVDELFLDVSAACVALINPSCSEGTGNVNVIAMARGLMPVISDTCALDIDESGIILPDCRIDTIRNTVRRIAELPHDRLKFHSSEARRIIRQRHTRERFTRAMRHALHSILSSEAAQGDVSPTSEGL